MRHRRTSERTDIWREGKWVDLWSVVHVLSGTLVGFCCYLLQVDPLVSVVVATVSFVVYELWEASVGIAETCTNRFMDVVTGMLGFLLAFFLVAPQLSQPWCIIVVGVVCIADGVMSVFGWRASQSGT